MNDSLIESVSRALSAAYWRGRYEEARGVKDSIASLALEQEIAGIVEHDRERWVDKAQQSLSTPRDAETFATVGRLRAWIRDFGETKEPAFIRDLKTVLDALHPGSARMFDPMAESIANQIEHGGANPPYMG